MPASQARRPAASQWSSCSLVLLRACVTSSSLLLRVCVCSVLSSWVVSVLAGELTEMLQNYNGGTFQCC